jgi:predicted  nucleic acid-binding Zn ribbon protein
MATANIHGRVVIKEIMMYYEMRFKAKANEFVRDIERIEDYLGCLYKNGQIVDYESIFIKGGFVYCCVTLPEDGAISKANDNEYAAKAKEEVERHFDVSLKTLGENWYLDDKICECKQPSHYVLVCNALIGDIAHTASPISCGDCGYPVPLYKLPKIFGEKDYYTVREFEREYRAIEQLWISCLDDRFTFKQRNNRSSPLVKKGRKICKAFEKATGVKFYYHMPMDDDINSEYCPFCGKRWNTEKDRECVDCRIIAVKNKTD